MKFTIKYDPRNIDNIERLIEFLSSWESSLQNMSVLLGRERKEIKIFFGYEHYNVPHLSYLPVLNRINTIIKDLKNRFDIDIKELTWDEISYNERINIKSEKYHTKSPNSRNRIVLYIEPLDPKTENLIESGKITDLMNAEEQTKILCEEARWDAKEAERIVDVYQSSVLVNETTGLKRFDRIKSYLSAAFRDWLWNGILAGGRTTGIKAVFTDLTIHEDPRYTSYGQIAGMLFSALSLSMLDADPQIYEPFFEISFKISTKISYFFNDVDIKLIKYSNENEYTTFHIECSTKILMFIIENAENIDDYNLIGFRKIPEELEHEILRKIRKNIGMSE
jgi:elongation factor 2